MSMPMYNMCQTLVHMCMCFDVSAVGGAQSRLWEDVV